MKKVITIFYILTIIYLIASIALTFIIGGIYVNDEVAKMSNNAEGVGQGLAVALGATFFIIIMYMFMFMIAGYFLLALIINIRLFIQFLCYKPTSNLLKQGIVSICFFGIVQGILLIIFRQKLIDAVFTDMGNYDDMRKDSK